ncbi:peptidylprolyl isomerase [Deinococcus ficus]|uniref:peptidylprolyl isomerase n=1 Tax=Deinococcus ficus TaxID=317577 RepID=UPI0003B6092B|nr:peptidylprolyl isomerase [Deinococcus ficus]
MPATLKLLPAALLASALSACTPTQSPTTGASTGTSLLSGYAQLTPLSTSPVRQFTAAQQVTDPTKTYRAVMTTSKGAVVLDLNPQAAPVAVNNFVFLALNHFYDGTRFHRVIEGFMAQGGDPLSLNPAAQDRWGTGGPGYQFMAEHLNGLKFDRPGVLAMARASAYTTQGSQFFITLAPTPSLNGEYTAFGQVVAGMNVVHALTKNYSNYGPIPGAGADTLNSVQIYVKQ